jgi:uncharacterized membrane protein
MSKPSKHLQMSISTSEIHEIELKVAAVESRVPLEIRVVLATHAGQYAMGSARLIALLCCLAAIVCYLMWIPHIPFLFSAIGFLVLMIPSEALAKLPISSLLVFKSERAAQAWAMAQSYFRTSDLSTTKQRNGVLLYFNTAERQFLILPDLGLKKVWPNDEWNHYAEDLSKILRSEKESPLKNGILLLLEKIRSDALAKLGPAPEGISSPDELSNAVVIL